MNKSLTLILIIILLSFGTPASAQNNAAEAKAAYLLAEEEFNAGKYESAIAYLNEATEKLGTANAKILYLKIMALQPLAEKDFEQLEALKQSIELFEKATDIESFNEEKKLEIYKLKLKVKRLNAVTPTNELELTAFKQMKISGLRLGMKLAALQKAEGKFFATATKTTTGDTDWFAGVYSDSSSISMVIKKGVLVQIDFFPPGQHSQDVVKNAIPLNQIKMKIGGGPKDTTTTETAGVKKIFSSITNRRTITWIDQNVRIELSQTNFVMFSKTKPKTTQSNYVQLSLIDDSLSK